MKNTQKTQKLQKTLHRLGFFTKLKKMEVFAFCVITFEPVKIWTCSARQNDGLNSEPQFCER